MSIPASSISTSSDKLNDELKGNQWFDAQRLPRIGFRSVSVTPFGKTGAKVAGELTLHGVTRPMTLDVQFVGAGVNPLDKYTVGFSAKTEINRGDCGMETYLPLIGDAVQVTLSGAFEK